MYGCHSKPPLKQTVTVQDGYTQSKPTASTRLPRMIEIPDPMTKDCQYTKTDLGKTDPKCFNCNWKQS